MGHMKSEVPEELVNEIEPLLRKGIELMGAQADTRARIRDRWKDDADRLLDAHLGAFAAVAGALDRKNGQPGKSSKGTSERLSLVASFVQGVDITEVTISEALYVQASTLLKQEMETITALDELTTQRRKDRKTPNVGNSPFLWAKEVYAELNAAAHVADAGVLHGLISQQLSEEVIGASLHPIYNMELSIYFYGLHVLMIAILANQLDHLHIDLYGEGLTDREKGFLVQAIRILQDIGWLRAREKVGGKEQTDRTA
jgi:hypothetical protein